MLAVLTPLVLVGLSALTADPDYATPCMIAGVVMLIVALMVLMTVRPNGWWLVPGILLGVVLVAVPGAVLKGEVLLHRGVRTNVVVTAAHHGRPGKDGRVHWTCDIRRADGKPLAHAVLQDADCWGQSQVGTTETVIVDPDGWTGPVSTDQDYSGLGVGVGVVGAAAALWALLALAAARRTVRLRTAG
ncbi:hypothetical protein [Peterkaempfera sp. SMS 1(5)a]|uniref:hypothetical protein n=1 Tax=Peterkaempfera podocarpi TaxID=3232308 RepID=UPI0036722642